VIDAPPLLDGAVQLSDTWLLPDVPISAVGAAGKVRGVIAAESADQPPVPAVFTAATLNI
jgi:hypothetical protein